MKTGLKIIINYEQETNYMRNFYSIYPFNKKLNKFYTSCIPHISKIPYFIYGIDNKDIIDGYIYGGSVHKYLGFARKLIQNLNP